MEEIRLTSSQAFLYTALIGAGVGFLLGLIPLIVGIVKKKVGLGVLGLIVGTLGGALLGVVVSIPSMALFTWLILRDRFVADATITGDVEKNGGSSEN
jgi:hypothetical protein